MNQSETLPHPACTAITGMPRSGIREVMDLAHGRKGVLHLEVGEPDFATPAHVIEAGARALREGHTRYTPNAGTRSLRGTVAATLRERRGICADAEGVVVTMGAVNALFTALMVLLEPGDAVMVPDPGWPNYAMMATMLGATGLPYPLERDAGYEPDLDRLATLAGSGRVKAIVINSPGNPTGAVWSAETMHAVLDIARTHGLYVVSDEVYEEIVFEGEHVSPATFDEEGRVLTVSSLSKTYAMTGWRVGYLAATPAIAALVAKAQEAIVACPNGAAQAAAEAALTGPQDCVAKMRDAYRLRRDIAVAALQRAGLLITAPRGAFYIFAGTGAADRDTLAFARQLVIEHGVAVAPGATFGRSAASLVRLSLASAPAVIEEGISRLAAALVKERE